MNPPTKLASPPETGSAASEAFDRCVRAAEGKALGALGIDTIQVNVGLRCNLACHHCHVRSSPARREEMSEETMAQVLDAARRAGARTLDITGGAPEMHPHFRPFVEAARAQGLHVIQRTNLTVLGLPGYERMPAFFAAQGVHLVASLPCYLEENVEKQRGLHVYRESIEAIRRLNALGYGAEDPGLQIDLVYNPVGPTLPPSQEALEDAYRIQLDRRFGIRFNRLFTITNMPIGRFQRDLERRGDAVPYERLLQASFNATTLDGLMCRHQLHVGWDGRLYDCDFNFALGLPAETGATHVRDFLPASFLRRRVVTGPHCFGCTAGGGSSCKGSLA